MLMSLIILTKCYIPYSQPMKAPLIPIGHLRPVLTLSNTLVTVTHVSLYDPIVTFPAQVTNISDLEGPA